MMAGPFLLLSQDTRVETGVISVNSVACAFLGQSIFKWYSKA